MAPTNIARALRLAAEHPAVLAIRIEKDDDSDVVAVVTIKNELPNAWRAAGESPTGVRSEEEVRLVFSPGFPIVAPTISLRQDFNRSHPHLNPGPKDQPPVPCIVSGSPRELIQARGFDGYIDQIVDWLDKAAMARLNDCGQDWEPMRRDQCDDVLIAEAATIRANVGQSSDFTVLPVEFFALEEDGKRRFVGVLKPGPVANLAQAANTFALQSLPNGAICGRTVNVIGWSGSDKIVSQYEPDTVTTLQDLKDAAERFGCWSPIDRALQQIAVPWLPETQRQQNRVPIFFDRLPLFVTMLIRRPRNIAGTGATIEICSYLVELKDSRPLIEFGQHPVRCCAIRDLLSIETLRRASGEGNRQRASWTLIGCGSVGSKIALAMARRGDAPTLVIDNGTMNPHNYARHALLPDSAQGLTGSKASLLAKALTTLKQQTHELTGDVLGLLAGDPTKIAQPDTAIALNTTASSIVREMLSSTQWNGRPSMAEAHLLGAGQVAYAAFEGPEANPSLSDLSAEAYRLIATEPDTRDIVFGAEAEAIQIGQGCSAITFPMPDSRLNALTGGLTEVVAKRLPISAHSSGSITIGRLQSDGLSQLWTQHDVEPFILLPSDNSGPSVRVSARVNAQIRQEIDARRGMETGGVIIGRFSQIGNSFHVIDLLPAPPDSTFSPEKFVLGTKSLKGAIRRVIRDSGGSLYVLGTWHNHLIKSGPSLLDAATAARLALKQSLPVLLLIALPEGYSFVTAEQASASTHLPRLGEADG